MEGGALVLFLLPTFVSLSRAQSDLDTAELSIVLSVCGGVVLIVFILWAAICCGFCRVEWKSWKQLRQDTETHRLSLERRQQHQRQFGRRERVRERSRATERPPIPKPSAPPRTPTPQIDRRFKPTFLSALSESASMEFTESLRLQRNRIQQHKTSVIGTAEQPASLFLSPNDPRLSANASRPSPNTPLHGQELPQVPRETPPPQSSTSLSTNMSSLQVPVIRVEVSENEDLPSHVSGSNISQLRRDEHLSQTSQTSQTQEDSVHPQTPRSSSFPSSPADNQQAQQQSLVREHENTTAREEAHPQSGVQDGSQNQLHQTHGTGYQPVYSYHPPQQPPLHTQPVTPRVVLGPYIPKSLREEEEMDVELDSESVPPRYSWLFPEQDRRTLQREASSPYSFNTSQPFTGNRSHERRYDIPVLGQNRQDVAMFGQLSSWPKLL